MNQPNYTLLNGEERAKENPKTFLIPDRKERDTCGFGTNCKLLFENPSTEDVERMWVSVTKVFPDGTYEGYLNNEPIVINAKYMDTVQFKPEHIIAIMTKTELAEIMKNDATYAPIE
jgi:hypothetical protein